MNKTKTSFREWVKRVIAVLDAQNVSEEIRVTITSPMLKDGWEKHEHPEYFVKTIIAY
jgi:hypothetical protein